MTVYAPGGGSSILGSTFSASPFDTFIGYQAGAAETTGTSNTVIGYQAGAANTTGASNVFIGALAALLNTTGGFNVYIGAQAGPANAGGTIAGVVAVGYRAGFAVQGANTVFVGYQAGRSSTTSAASTMIGSQAGYAPGGTAANATTTGMNQTLIGFNTGQNSATQRNDIVAVGYQALCDGNNAIAIGSGVLAGAAGTVAIGKDSAGTSASSTVANEIKLGTALHTVNIIGKTKIAAQARTAGALPTVQLVSTTGAQIDTTADRETVTAVTFNPSAGASATALVEVSPDNATYTAVGTWTIPAGVTFDGTIELISVAIPAGWYLRVTTTNATLGLTTYY